MRVIKRVINVITQTDDPDAADAVVRTADEWGCLTVVIDDGCVTRAVASEEDPQ